MRRFLVAALSSAALLAGCARLSPTPIAPGEGPEKALRANTEHAVDAILSRPALAATHIGLAVWSLDRKQWLIERNADRLFVPASNAKILVAVAALASFGPATTFRTNLFTDASPNRVARDSLLRGDLYLVGGGNPDLSTGDMADFAEALRALGVKRIRGDVILDASRFDSTAFGPGWMWDEGPYPYNAPLSGFILNRNAVRLTIRPGQAVGEAVSVAVSPRFAAFPLLVRAVTRSDTVAGPPLTADRPGNAKFLVVGGSMVRRSRPVIVTRTVPEPVAYAESVFMGALADAGIVVDGRCLAGPAPDSGIVLLATAASAPVDVLVRRFLKRSDNLLGEALVKQLGWSAARDGSWSAGLSAVRRTLDAFAGLDSTTYRLADGSGLSRYTEVSPRMLARLVARASETFAFAPEFLSALSVGGLDGTLARRFTDPDLAGNIRAKTGTMSGVSSLSGILLTRDGERLAFSLLMNGFIGSAKRLRRAQDDVIAVLRSYPRPQGPRATSPDHSGG